MLATHSLRPLSRLLLRRARLNMTTSAAEQRGHQAPANSPPPDAALVAFREHQSKAPRQAFADECRTLLRLSRYGVLSTLSSKGDAAGFPSGSVVGFADELATGAPIMVFSSMSSHTGDVLADGRCSLTVTAPGFEGAADARVSLTGRVALLPEAEVPAARERYLAVHPDAFWVTFGDFSFFKMTEIVSIRLIGGFARAGAVPPALYAAAQPDPVAALCGQLIVSANAAGEEAWARAVRTAVGADLGMEGVRVLSLDCLGLNLAARRGVDSYKMRLPFAKPAKSVADVQSAIYSMLSS
jgi:putative heme iron utilization protein